MSAIGVTSRAADPALPFFERLLDPEAAAAVLGVADGDVAVRSLRYKPGRRLVVEYAVAAEGGARSAVAAVDRKAGPLPSVHWYPCDPALPALWLTPDELAARLGIGGGAAPERLGYKPFARATLRLGSRVVKLYASREKFRAAAGALERLSGAVAGAPFEHACEPLLATVQGFLEGGRPAGDAAAEEAGELLARLHGLSPGRLRRVGAGRRLGEAERSAAIVAAVAPALAPRVQALAGRLRRAMPAATELVTSHGDFEPGQLVESALELAVVDLDELCAAPPSDDLAWYAAHAARGRPTDAEAVETVAAALVAGYGRRPPDLGWYLAASILARSAFPFRRQLAPWPERVEQLVAAAEAFG